MTSREVASTNRQRRRFAILGFHHSTPELRETGQPVDVARVRLFKPMGTVPVEEPETAEDITIALPEIPLGVPRSDGLYTALLTPILEKRIEKLDAKAPNLPS